MKSGSKLDAIFRNLMIGEHNELKNRYMVVNPPSENYLNPAMKEGLVTMLYPNSPRPPRQKYLLTVNVLAVCNSMQTVR